MSKPLEEMNDLEQFQALAFYNQGFQAALRLAWYHAWEALLKIENAKDRGIVQNLVNKLKG